MRNYFILIVFLWSSYNFAVTMNFSGHFRGEATLYNGLNLGFGSMEKTKQFISARALLQPNLIVDDHFSVKSQWSLLTSPTLTPNSVSPMGTGQSGYIFGDVNTQSLVLSRVWLEWTSDFGVLRVGRMPVSWGYGLLWDSGDGIWDDFQSTLDRMEYRLHLGHLTGALAYSKARKFTLVGSSNDQEFYTAYLQYKNPEMEIEGGILYEKQVRGSGQQDDLMGTSNPAVPSNPYKLPASHPNPYPLSNKTPYPMSNHVLDAYVKKTSGYFTFGGEAAWLTGDATDYNGNGTRDSLNAFGVRMNGAFTYHDVKAVLDIVYASGDGNLNADHMNGFVLLNKNRRPGIILGRELLGPYYSNLVGFGSLVVYGNQDTFSGVFFVNPSISVDWSSSWSTGLEFITAFKAASAAGEASYLGTEVDVGTTYGVYKNFDVGLNLAYLLPGSGLQVSDPKGAFAIRTTAAVRF